jgi:elongation factor P
MIQAGSLRPGTKFLHNKEPYIVVDITFVKPGKGGAFARVKVRNLLTHLQREITFRNEEKLDQPDMSYVKAKYIYASGNSRVFMDEESFEEISMNKDELKGILDVLKEEEVYTFQYWNEKCIDIQPPIHITLSVVEAPPGVKGDTAQGGGKTVICETGLSVITPLFVAEGDMIKVDTRTCEYVERVKLK